MGETFKVGVDVGGTFTDLFVWSSLGAVETFKALSTPDDPGAGVMDGLDQLAASRGVALADLAPKITTIVHGTTVATNATLTRNGAKTGLLTTAGIRDALEMRRGIREKQYDNRLPNAKPVVPRYLRRTIAERIDWRGEELAPIDLEAVRTEARALAAEGVQAVAICFMNAFANPAHERAALDVVRRELPTAFVSTSTEVLPVIRFYNRISTTALNAYVGPVVRDYLAELERKLANVGFAGTLLIMQSNGGVAQPAVTAKLPATTLLSGPAGGPEAAARFSAEHNKDLILVDMGGTSFDASLVRDGRAAMSAESEIDRLRIALPMLAIHTIGAGGGSIGWIDAGGLLRMGPQSAGAMPGPACYARGGTLPTCTDANLVLGYLDPEFFAGGKMRLDRSRAEKAVEEHIAKPLGVDRLAAAVGMVRVINTNMAHGVREITIKRGLDPREFILVSAGGAAGVHASAIASELEIPTVLVPAAASILCAAGMLLSDLQHDFLRSAVRRFSEIEWSRLNGLVREMMGEGARLLESEGVSRDKIDHEVALDLRYLRQYHEVTLPVPAAAIATGDVKVIAAAFHEEHDRLYGYELSADGTELELINVRVRSIGRTDKPVIPRVEAGTTDASAAVKGRRRAWVMEHGEVEDIPVYDGHRLRANNLIPGPALIERADTTILVGADYDARVDSYGGCLLVRRGKEPR